MLRYNGLQRARGGVDTSRDCRVDPAPYPRAEDDADECTNEAASALGCDFFFATCRYS